MKGALQFWMVIILVVAFGAIIASADWYYDYFDSFDSDKAQADSYDHSIFWPEAAFPPAEPWLYFSSNWGKPPRGLVFMDYLGAWAYLNYCFPLGPMPADMAVAGVIEFDVGYLPDSPGSYLAYSISPDGHIWTIPMPLGPGHHSIPVGSAQATCYIGLQGTKAFIDNLRVRLVSPPPDIRVPDDYATIQEAIDAAAPGQIVEVAPGSYSGSGNWDLDFRGKAITLRSLMGPEETIIDCFDDSGVGPAGHRGFYFHQGEGRDSILRGFTIRNGFIPGSELPPFDSVTPWPADPALPIGGGIFCAYAGPTIEDCIIEKCRTELGGGIGCVGGGALIGSCRIAGCHAGGLGPAESGGRGGGIGLVHTAEFVIQDCLIQKNLGYYNSRGGGIFAYGAEVSINHSVLAGNHADGNMIGGGLYGGPGCHIRLQNCLLYGNLAQSGAGIYTESSPEAVNTTLLVKNCTIADNHWNISMPPFPGCGIHSDGSDIQVRNSIVWFNDMPQLLLMNPPAESPVVYSNVQGGWMGAGNINANPWFADRAAEDYHLQSITGRYYPQSGQWVSDPLHSPSIDAGDPADPAADEPLPNGGRINQGAYGGTWQASKSRGPNQEPVILFSTEESFVATAGPHAGELISHGDLLDTTGRVVVRNGFLTRNFHPEPPTPDYGLDGIQLGPGTEVFFSLEESFWDESLSQMVGHGDWLSDQGMIVHTNGWLLQNFHPMPSPGPYDYGLDGMFGFQQGLAFSIEDSFFDESLSGMVKHGDLLSPAGVILRTNDSLLQNFHPMPSPDPDYGLDAVQVMSLGEVWFSIEETFWDEVLGQTIGHGDLLSDGGKVVKTNQQLLAAFFNPTGEVHTDLGLDALWVGPGCVRPPSADLNGDCRVDIYDLAILAAEWLDCGWEPQELCNSQ